MKIENNCTSTYYYRAADLAENTTVTDAIDSTKTYTVGDETDISDTTIPVSVSAIKVENKTWSIKSFGDELKAGEIAMSINGFDLSTALGDTAYDINALGWVAEESLALPVNAAIAGGSVNGDTENCVPVVSVTYTITPKYE